MTLDGKARERPRRERVRRGRDEGSREESRKFFNEIWSNFIKTTYEISLDSQISFLPLGFSPTKWHGEDEQTLERMLRKGKTRNRESNDLQKLTHSSLHFFVPSFPWSFTSSSPSGTHRWSTFSYIFYPKLMMSAWRRRRERKCKIEIVKPTKPCIDSQETKERSMNGCWLVFLSLSIFHLPYDHNLAPASL